MTDQHIIESIDNALTGYEVSRDAMRWTPDAEQVATDLSRPMDRRIDPVPPVVTGNVSPHELFDQRRLADVLHRISVYGTAPTDELLHMVLGIGAQTLTTYPALPTGLRCPPPMTRHIYYAELSDALDLVHTARRDWSVPVRRPQAWTWERARAASTVGVTFAPVYELLKLHRCTVGFPWAERYTWPVLIDDNGRWIAGRADISQ